MNNPLEDLNMGELFDKETQNELDELLKASENIMTDWHYDTKEMVMKLKIPMINKSTNPDPEFHNVGDSGFDIRAFIENGKAIEIEPGSRALIPTGLYFQVPLGYELQVRSRSGLALKHGIMVLNSPGTVDSGYRGEVGVILYNSDKNNIFYVHHGDRIAQGVIASVIQKNQIKFMATASLSESDRGSGGFGSTGVQ
jgi:dUTP pyrophosphatase